MVRPSRIRCTFLLLLALALLGALPISAEAEPGGSHGFDPRSLAARLWVSLSGLWSENGCSVDPNGACGASSQAATAENGCSVDPDGRCAGRPAGAATESLDEGCSVDPSGGCGR